jgi:sugar phosphate isomerase/epimerase
MEVVVFTKPMTRLGNRSVEAIPSTVKELSVDGVDLAVRDGGCVSPGSVLSDLPRAVDLFEDEGLSVPMITTTITGTTPQAKEIFEAAETVGVEYIKLGYWGYEGFGTLENGLREMREDIVSIREMAKNYGVTPALHTHSGPFLNVNPAFLWETIVNGRPDDLGVYPDTGHLVMAGSREGWKLNLDLIQDYIQMVQLKDMAWFQESTNGGNIPWEFRNVPYGEGLVPFESFFQDLNAIDFDGPVSIYGMYDGFGYEETISQICTDVRHIRDLLG